MTGPSSAHTLGSTADPAPALPTMLHTARHESGQPRRSARFTATRGGFASLSGMRTMAAVTTGGRLGAIQQRPRAPKDMQFPQVVWWRGLDSNQRRRSQRIYSPSPLATRAPILFAASSSNGPPASSTEARGQRQGYGGACRPVSIANRNPAAIAGLLPIAGTSKASARPDMRVGPSS